MLITKLQKFINNLYAYQPITRGKSITCMNLHTWDLVHVLVLGEGGVECPTIAIIAEFLMKMALNRRRDIA